MLSIRRFVYKIRGKVSNRFRRFCREKSLKNNTFSVISNNCLGGVVTHYLGVRLNSPTINLFIEPDDYLLFLDNLKFYIYADIEDVSSPDRPYPVGLLGGKIYLYFMHYHSFEEAVSTWRRRAERVNWDNLFVVIQQINGCEYECLQRFDRLPYPRKLAITYCHYPDIQSGFYIQGMENFNILESSEPWEPRHFEVFDWVAFFNENKIQKSKI